MTARLARALTKLAKILLPNLVRIGELEGDSGHRSHGLSMLVKSLP